MFSPDLPLRARLRSNFLGVGTIAVNANSQSAGRELDDVLVSQGMVAAMPGDSAGVISVRATQRIEDVEAAWRQLTSETIESPGLNFDFIRLWVRDRGIAPRDQIYVVAERDGHPVALLPLHRRRVNGTRVVTWFPGSHVGCYAPLADLNLLEALGRDGRARLWHDMVSAIKGVDLLYLRSIPIDVGGRTGLFDELGSHLEVETLYRAEFSSWEQCDREQRSRTRRKHDRQQGDRLDALGAVSFEEITEPVAAHAAVDIMFQQRSARFKAQGIRDSFVVDKLTGFYHDALEPASGVRVRLHALRLDGAIVAIRYNIVHGDRMFCLISSMSDCAHIQSGSPGKQCLLRVMQTVFEQGYRVFDMGAGFTDEKRHWCNVQLRLRHHYVPVSAYGHLVVFVHSSLQRLRVWAKSNKLVKAGVRTAHQFAGRLRGPKASDQL